jgi:hypothetical protein
MRSLIAQQHSPPMLMLMLMLMLRNRRDAR